MKFSVIIPAHNSEDTIAACIDSIAGQSDVELQIIIVENGSIDNTLDVCKRLQDKFDNIEVYTSDIASVSVARNIGLKHATGDIITFCDADDYLLPDTLKKVEYLFEKNDVQIICTGYQIKSGAFVLKRASSRDRIVSSSRMIEYILCNPNTMGSVWNKYFRKELLENAVFRDDLTYLEDGFFNVEVLSENEHIKVYVSTMITYCYVSNENSVTNDYSNLFDENSNLKYLNSLNEMLSLPLSDKEKRYVYDDIFRIAVGTMWDKKVKKTPLQSIMLYREIKKTFIVFALRVFRFDWKSRVRLLVRGGVTCVDVILKRR